MKYLLLALLLVSCSEPTIEERIAEVKKLNIATKTCKTLIYTSKWYVSNSICKTEFKGFTYCIQYGGHSGLNVPCELYDMMKEKQ